MVIVFAGSVFSPHYARARERGPADPLSHLAVNVALYGPGRDAWAFTERPADAALRGADLFALGGTVVERRRDGLTVRFDEPRVPFAGRLRGRVSLEAEAEGGRRVLLDRDGRHRWWPLAPVARAEVQLEEPALSFSGRAYHDANEGDAPLEDDFRRWAWWRLAEPGGTRVGYDVVERDGRETPRSVFFGPAGPRLLDGAAGPSVELGRTGWGLRRPVRVPPHGRWTALRTLEDGPFYSRTLLGGGGPSPGFGIHEAVDLERFCAPWVRFLTGFRLRRLP